MAAQFATVGLALVKQLEVVIGEELVDSLCLPLQWRTPSLLH
jgi:hypothetical protein